MIIRFVQCNISRYLREPGSVCWPSRRCRWREPATPLALQCVGAIELDRGKKASHFHSYQLVVAGRGWWQQTEKEGTFHAVRRE